MSMPARRGFTLVEVLVAAALYAGIALAVFMCLSNGLALWARTRTTVADEDRLLFLDRFYRDVRNAFSSAALSMRGTELAFEFPTVVSVPADPGSSRSGAGMVDVLGRVRYEYDPGTGELTRRQAGYGQGVRGEWGAARVLLRRAGAVHFRYFTGGDVTGRPSADGDELPAGVEVEILPEEGGPEERLVRYVPVPAGGGV